VSARRFSLSDRTLVTTPLRAIVVLAVVAIGVSGATVAFGAIGDSGTVVACVSTSKGTWRVLTHGSCRSSEQAVELYTKAGADAAFLTQEVADEAYLSKTAMAADSDKLDGKDSTDFLPYTNCIGYPHIGIDWHGCDLFGANLNDARLFQANLSGANFRFAGLIQADLRGADLTSADLTNANLFGASMFSANLTDVIWSNTTCPDGTTSDNNGGTCVGHI
jgi:hypothetical protein